MQYHVLCFTSSKALKAQAMFQTTGNVGSTGIGNFGRLKAQKVKSLVMRSANLKRENSKHAIISRADKSSFYDSDEEENIFERRKGVPSDLASRASTRSSSRNERTQSAHSLNSVLSQYRGDDDLGSQSSEAHSGSKRWGNVTDVTFGQQNRKPKGPFWTMDFSVVDLLRRLAAAMTFYVHSEILSSLVHHIFR